MRSLRLRDTAPSWFGAHPTGRVAVGLLAVASLLGACSNEGGAPRSSPAPDPERFGEAIARFDEEDAARPPVANPIVFVGSSSIVGWPLESSFPGLPTLNRGLGGAHLSDLLHHLDRIVLGYRPHAVVVYAGENDVHDGTGADVVLERFDRLVQSVHSRMPEADVVLVSIKPSPGRWGSWASMARVNDGLRNRAAPDPRLHYVDVASVLVDPDGRPRPEFFADDGVHLTEAGYRLWTAAVAPVLERLEPR
jgi:lysophospholipase L1-like esterase